MNTKKIFLVFFAISLLGCAKKIETTEKLDETQLALNQAVPTQTELKLMQDKETIKSETTSSEQSTGSQSAQAVSAVSESSLPPSQDQGFKEPGVKEIQQALKNANLYQGKIDGDLGPRTKKAIEDFQEKNNLRADGKVGPKTWAKLQTYLNAEPAVAPAEPKD